MGIPELEGEQTRTAVLRAAKAQRNMKAGKICSGPLKMFQDLFSDPIAFSPDADTLAMAQRDCLNLVRPDTGEWKGRVYGDEIVEKSLFCENGRRVAVVFKKVGVRDRRSEGREVRLSGTARYSDILEVYRHSKAIEYLLASDKSHRLLARSAE